MSSRVTIIVDERPLAIEYEFVGNLEADAPWLIVLHEGLGSVAMWSDFPARLCTACGVRGLVYSRPGYGHSTPCSPHARWPKNYLHKQARGVLTGLMQVLDAPVEYALFGHSDGATIALIHAADNPDRVRGVIALAPHIRVEDMTVAAVEHTREQYLHTDLRQRLARYHDDVDSAFWGWNDVWRDPNFRDWSIEQLIPRIKCPVVAIQGEQDEYASMNQVRGIKRALAPGQCLLLPLAHCGHLPHRDQPATVIRATRKLQDSGFSFTC
jgi:pimeloyl-ACP methyl ester carboxylesterase